MERNDIINAALGYARENLISRFTPGKTYIHPAAPLLDPQDVAALVDVALGMWYTEWKECRKFQKALEEWTGKSYADLVNSGSSASLVAITSALREFDPDKKRRYVITCALGFPTTVTPIIQNGYVPIYVDINLDLTPNLEQIQKALDEYGDQVAGVVLAHSLGFPFQEEDLMNLLHTDQFFVVNCCDAFGARLRGGHPVGSLADYSTYSFFPSHHIMAGEGGAVITNVSERHDLVRAYSNWGRSCFCRPGQSNTCGMRFEWPERGALPDGWDHKYIFSEIGYNLKMTEFQGALGYSQIQRGKEIVAAHRAHYRYLYEQLRRYEDAFHLLPPSDYASPFGFLVRTTERVDTADMIAYLEEHKVGTRRLFGGNLLRQPAFMVSPYVSMGNMQGADTLMKDAFWISVSPSLTEGMLEYMVYAIEQYLVERGLA